MVCPSIKCRSRNIRTQRSVHPWTENEWPKRFAGINGILRRRYCGDCGLRIVTLELPDNELEKLVARGYIPSTTPLT